MIARCLSHSVAPDTAKLFGFDAKKFRFMRHAKAHTPLWLEIRPAGPRDPRDRDG